MPPLLALENVYAGYGPIEVLKGISLEVRAGEIVALIGANGAGKTSTLLCISGCLRRRGGRVLLDGQPIERTAPHDIVRRGVCQSPEGRRIFGRLTVLENLQMGAFSRRDRAGIERDLAHALELFPILGQRRNQPGGTLSGGEQQMLAVARALMSRPQLLLLDEPSLGLAPQVVERIFQVLREVSQAGVSLLLVEQNAHKALQIAHQAYVLETGEVVMKGTGSELLASPEVRKAYLGE